MLRDSVNEIRLKPGRFVATLIAIAISVGFIAAISTLVSTEQQGMARSNQPALSKADIVVDGVFDDADEVRAALEGVDGVSAVQLTSDSMSMLQAGDRSAWVSLLQVPGESFRWAELTEGRWPSNSQEIALSGDGISQLGIDVGDQVTGYGGEQAYTVVGATNDPKSLYSVLGYSDLSEEIAQQEATYGSWAVQAQGRPVADVMAEIADALPDPLESEWEIQTGEDARTQALNDLTADFDVFKNLLYGFAAIALLVGMIIISNTFTILVTQRRRQIGLLRAVGASTSQVRGRLVTEALLLGLLGSAIGVLFGIGVAAAGAAFTGSLFWGLMLRPVELLVAVLVGTTATVISVLGPAITATKVAPLEALQVVPSPGRQKRLGTIRIVVCALFLVLGAALAWYSRVNTELSLVWAIGAGALLSVAVLGAAPLYVAPLGRLIGRIFGFAGPTVRLAAENTARNPRRAGATAVALMLAVGLVVTIQVGLATVRSSALAAIDEQYPTDLVVRTLEVMDPDWVERVRQAPGTDVLLEVQSKSVDTENWGELIVRDINPVREALDLPDRLAAPDGVLLVPEWSADGSGGAATVELPGVSGGVELEVRVSTNIPWGHAAVSAATYEQLAGTSEVREFWLKLTDRTDPTVLGQVISVIEEGPADLQLEGGAVAAGVLEQVVNVILIVLSALLGVAVIIALVGVGNTLGLSVIERQRESALLRALGMQRSALRLMLWVEALILALIGTVTGIVAGAFFGWLGVSSALLMMPLDEAPALHFSVDLGWTFGLIGICIAAASLASVLPGRRAANATPTEALAAD